VQLITLAGSWGMLRDEKFCLLGYNYIWSVESQPTFWRKVLPQFSGVNGKPSKKPAWSRQQWFMLVSCLALLFKHENWGNILQNIGWLSTIHIVTDLHYAGHTLPRSYVTRDTAVTTQR
jgi:hypothetical protein